MQIKVTAAEFERRMLEALMARSPTTSTAVVAREVAIQAGVEFAPEPFVLPVRLRRDGDCNTRFDSVHEGADGKDLYWIDLPLRDRAALLDAMHARYNAYPGLREAALRLCERLEAIDADSYVACGTDGYLGRLKAELAKGPK